MITREDRQDGEGRKDERFRALLAPFAFLALLVLFLGTFRRVPHDASAQAVAPEPTSVAALVDRGDGYVQRGRTDLAEDAYRRALALDPSDGDLHVRLGELLLERGDRAGARAEADVALRWHPGAARAVSLAARSGAAAGAVSDP